MAYFWLLNLAVALYAGLTFGKVVADASIEGVERFHVIAMVSLFLVAMLQFACIIFLTM